MKTNSETYFFRDHGQFDLLRRILLPELIARRTPSKTLRLWSAGCASGEEAYSLAILLDMLLPERDDWTILIIGSDISSDALAKAGQARYGQWSFRQVPAELQERYFLREQDQWTLEKRIRDMVRFRAVDLIAEPFPNIDFQDMDLILCRNVFIYFDADTVTTVANKLAATLNDGGYLMTAHAELSDVHLPDMRSRLFTASVVYQRLSPIPAQYAPAVIDKPTPSLPPPTVKMGVGSLPSASTPVQPNLTALLTTAQALADRGEYHQAEQICHQILTLAPLLAAPHFLLAQVAQLQGNFRQAREHLEKTLYLAPDNTGALLELAALYERDENLARAASLRRTALNIVRELPGETLIEPYEMTAAEIARRLSRCTAA